jgi:hypothetical protein
MDAIFLSNKINYYKNNVIDKLTERDIQFYQFIKDEFAATNVSTNEVFQFIYSSFYTLDNIKLTAEFKKEYFNIMESVRFSNNLDLEYILLKLHEIPIRGVCKYHFSFTSKLIHTIDSSFPIWDSEILRMFQMKRPSGKSSNQILSEFKKQIDLIKSVYIDILKNNLLSETIELFDFKFKNNNIPMLKKIDFIFWAAGKANIIELLFGDNGMHSLEELEELENAQTIRYWNQITEMRKNALTDEIICTKLGMTSINLKIIEEEYNVLFNR